MAKTDVHPSRQIDLNSLNQRIKELEKICNVPGTGIGTAYSELNAMLTLRSRATGQDRPWEKSEY